MKLVASNVIWLVLFLYILSGSLPIFGLLGLYREASKNLQTLAASNHGRIDAPTYGWQQEKVESAFKAIADEPKRIKKELFLIGGGVLLGTMASIISLFLSRTCA